MGGKGSKDKSRFSQISERLKQRPLFFKSGKLAEAYLGKLKEEHHQQGIIILDSDSDDELAGLEKLCSVSTFVFTRLNEQTKDGFGFRCEIALKKNGGNSGHFIVSQLVKPKRGYIGKEDSPLTIQEISRETINSHTHKQILEIVFQKGSSLNAFPDSQSNSSKSSPEDVIANQPLFISVQVNYISHVIGEITIVDDWTTAYELKNDKNVGILIANRIKRLSGGIEFQVFSTEETDSNICLATIVRLEEAKFILKFYTEICNENKALVISFVIFLIYRLSR